MIWRVIFGARAQVAVGVMLFLATVAQTVWWLFIHPPTVRAVFIVSMEALAFAAYGIVATGLGYRATERVETTIEQAEEVTVTQSSPSE